MVEPDAAASAHDSGAAAVLAIAIAAATVVFAVAVASLAGALTTRQGVVGAADAAALAAADAASGAVAGAPCALAEHIASVNGSELTACVVDGLIATVEASAVVAGLPVRARATAGPPESG
ncbi:Rv3654c family TadE-like protein [Marisediminicola sp. LYQ85]|uniref:Rv3654c family TadE-like protein n=1 Tax=Marisediminicola sp. LYQ85 TaxID=3391062 RepID=UPI003983745C